MQACVTGRYGISVKDLIDQHLHFSAAAITETNRTCNRERISNDPSKFSRTNATINSKIVKVYSKPASDLNIHPVPFDEKLYVDYPAGLYPDKIILTDIMGRNIRIRTVTREISRQVEIVVLERIEPGMYIIHLRTAMNIVSKTIIKR